MDDSSTATDDLLRLAAQTLTGHARRRFQAEVTDRLCGGSPRRAERRFGWGRATIALGQDERRTGIRYVEDFAAHGCPRVEDADPQLAGDIRSVVE